MALSAPPFAEQNASHSAALFRQATSSALFQAHGVLGSNDYTVTAQSTPNMSVQVNAGQAWVQGSSVGTITGIGVGTQGSYYALNDAPVTLSINTANATNPRIDVVYLRILDTAFGDASNTAILGVVTGVAAASPAVPALPANTLDLAHVRVNAGVTSILNANISGFGRDMGSNKIVNQAIAAGAILITSENSLPSAATRNPQLGQMALATDTFNLYIYLGGGSWQPVNGNDIAGIGTIYQTTAQTGLGSGSFITLTLAGNTGATSMTSDGTGFTIGANQGGVYWVDGLVAATNFSTTNTELATWVTVNGTFPAATSGGRAVPVGVGSAYHTSVPLGGRALALSPGDTVRLVAEAGATWATYAAASNVASWLSLVKLAGGANVTP